MNKYHTSVLLLEVMGGLAVQKNEQYIDATLGGGGHTEAILEKGGKIVSFSDLIAKHPTGKGVVLLG